jgi:hypothetical protein
MTNEQISAANRATANEKDWTKDRQREELAVEKMLRPAPHCVRYFTEDTSADFLREIERENTNASNNHLNDHA